MRILILYYLLVSSGFNNTLKNEIVPVTVVMRSNENKYILKFTKASTNDRNIRAYVIFV